MGPVRIALAAALAAAALVVGCGEKEPVENAQVLFLQLGPLELNVLGLLVELFGESRDDPVTVTVTAFRGGGLLGDLFCGLAGGPPPAV